MFVARTAFGIHAMRGGSPNICHKSDEIRRRSAWMHRWLRMHGTPHTAPGSFGVHRTPVFMINSIMWETGSSQFRRTHRSASQVSGAPGYHGVGRALRATSASTPPGDTRPVSSIIAGKLVAIFAVVGLGWIAGRTRLLGGSDATRTVSNVAFYVFTPALLFRTTARIDLGTMPWSVIAAYFGPVMALLLIVYGWRRTRAHQAAAEPAVRAISTTFGNTVQIGIPVVTALFGEAGLKLHVAVISLHALTLLTVPTVLAELDLTRVARATEPPAPDPAGIEPPGIEPPGVLAAVVGTARRTVLHPVVLPVLAGLAWNLVGLPVSGPLDATLATLAQAVVPVCLVLIGMSLALYGLAGIAAGAAALSVGKLLVQPAAVFAAAHWGAGLHGTALGTVVLCAALPIGSNALLFAQRYETLEAETTAAVVASTLAFTVTGPAWVLLASQLAP